jgi:SLT domain-containing protein
MASAGADWATNPATQINWGLGYIKGRYGSPAGAEAHEQAFNWYGNGDIINTPTFGVLGEAGPEVVLPLNRPHRASQLAAQAGIGDRHYHLTVYNAANNEINLKAQFKRLEIESGML